MFLRLFSFVFELLVDWLVILVFFDIFGGIIGFVFVVVDGNWLGLGLMLFRVFKFKLINFWDVKLGSLENFGRDCFFLFRILLVFFWVVEVFFNRWFKFRLFRFNGFIIK